MRRHLDLAQRLDNQKNIRAEIDEKGNKDNEET